MFVLYKTRSLFLVKKPIEMKIYSTNDEKTIEFNSVKEYYK